jgi:hypothetical protein
MTGIFMGVYFAWAVMIVMSSRVFLNLVLAVHGGGRGTEGITTGTIPTFRTRPEHRVGAEESEQVVTFGAKPIRHSVPLTTFSTVS